ncbi:MAG TPA: alpha/beta hydrolase [Candidatus Acidoferrales bacterium]
MTIFAALWSLAVLLLVLGILLPRLPIVGVIGTLLESVFSLHIFLVALASLALAFFARRRSSTRAANFVLTCAILATLGSLIPLVALTRTAAQYNAPISWLDHLHVTARFNAALRDQTILYATVDGKNLYADVYLPPNPPPNQKSPVILVMHGGGYIHGHRSMMRTWDRWFTARGYTVFDIDYRLAPPPTWNQAAQDAACSMVYIAANAEKFHVDGTRILVAGQSAGGGLALQLAYGIGDGTVKSSCGGEPPPPQAVFALYGPDDFILGWNLRTRIGPADGRNFSRLYTGGSPDEFPGRYRAISAVFHVRPGLPPMLIAAGIPDHLVPYGGHEELVNALNQNAVPNVFLAIPYSDHAYDVLWGSLGGQITRHVLEDFLQKYFPASH